MLTDLQKEKLTHYFHLLDFDHNGVIEENDFTSIGENLCILWGFREGTDKYNHYMTLFGRCWSDFQANVAHNNPDHATLDEWLEFADQYIVNGEDEFYDRYVIHLASEIFDCFDQNGDGYISLEEYIDMFMAYHIEVRHSAKSYIKLDLNSDDMLSKAELLAGVNQFFRSNDPLAPGNFLYGFWEK